LSASGLIPQGRPEIDMPNPHTAEQSATRSFIQPNAEHRYEVTRAELPLHCPLDGMSLWNSHPRVYLPIEDTGAAKCPYCGADYILVDRSG
jgi:uncharacterized Zn-finger protein